MSAIKSAMARMNATPIFRRFSVCSILSAIVLAGTLCFAEAAYEKAALVRVNVTTELQGAGDSLIINGRLLDDYNPTVSHIFSSAGVVFDNVGHIMTFLGYGRIFIEKNGSRFDITAPEGQRYKGELVGIDHGNGAAVILVEGVNLRETSLCADCDIREGATVIAPVIAGSGGTQFQATQVISINAGGVAREESGLVVRMNRPFLDVGQPVFADGFRVLGFIVSQDLSGMQNVVYPVSELLSSARKILEKKGDIRTGWLGVKLGNIRTPSGSGVQVQGVDLDSPAQEAGIAASDILLEYDGRKVDDALSLIHLVQDTPVGSRVELGIVRRGQPMALTALIRARTYQNPLRHMSLDLQDPFAPRGAPLNPDLAPGLQRPRIGFETVALTPDLADYLQVRNSPGLVVVNSVKQSPGDLAGIKNGDVIMSVNDQPVTDAQKVSSYLRTLQSGSSVSMRVLRKNTERTVTVKVPEIN